MFCSNCGKKIAAADNICNNCGNKNEPLRLFKKLDLDIGDAQTNQKQNIEIIKDRIIYRNSPKQKKIIHILFAALVILLLTIAVETIFISRINTSIKHTLPVSQKSYQISGNIETTENNYLFVKIEKHLKFDIDNQSYETDKIYLAPNVSITDDRIDLEGRICKLTDDVFMLIGNDF